MRPLAARLLTTLAALAFLASAPARAEYPVQRPPRATPAAAEGNYAIYPDQPRQVIKGLAFEIQSDSIASANAGLPEATTSVPHDLVPAERERFYQEMLKGFRYCRLAGGLYWRGLDPEKKYHQGRWPEQMSELKEMIEKSGVEGISLEYWSPAPFWKANGKYTGHDKTENTLRCFGRKFAHDPVYHGDTNRFLQDFAQACRHDLQYLRDQGIPIAMWGLQNEPFVDQTYSSCVYRTPQQYSTTFLAVAPVVRAFDPKIAIIADTTFTPQFELIRPVLLDPAHAGLVDNLVIHHIGSDANVVKPTAEKIRRLYGCAKPAFENEYEYLAGPASPARCLNTVQHLMNWLQLGEAPTWFWIHALKPVKNAEASGYSLGFWRPMNDADPKHDAKYKGLQPGHWTWNKYNWHAVGSFVRHMPWDCQAVQIKEEQFDNDLRLLAFKRPNGKLTIVLSNRSFSPHNFHLTTGLAGATFKGFRYTPENAGPECNGVEIGTLNGGAISPQVPDLAWEFWEQQ